MHDVSVWLYVPCTKLLVVSKKPSKWPSGFVSRHGFAGINQTHPMLQTAQKSASEQHRRLPKRKHGAHPRFFKRGVAAARKWARFCAQKLGRSLPRRPKNIINLKKSGRVFAPRKWAGFRAQKMGRFSRPENGQDFAPRKWAGFRAQKMVACVVLLCEG